MSTAVQIKVLNVSCENGDECTTKIGYVINNISACYFYLSGYSKLAIGQEMYWRVKIN